MMACALVVIGASRGGFGVIRTIITALPSDFAVPVIVVIHRRAGSENLLAGLFGQDTHLRVTEACDKEPIEPGTIYLAPPDYHLLIEDGHFALSTDEPVLYARPAIDVLFESAADMYGRDIVGVILTGASTDGAAGLAAIRHAGGMTIVQDPREAEAPVMPEAAIATARPDTILPAAEIGKRLVTICTEYKKRKQR